MDFESRRLLRTQLPNEQFMFVCWLNPLLVRLLGGRSVIISLEDIESYTSIIASIGAFVDECKQGFPIFIFQELSRNLASEEAVAAFIAGKYGSMDVEVSVE